MQVDEHQTAAKNFQRYESQTTDEDPFSPSIRKQFEMKKRGSLCCNNFLKFETVALILMIITNVILLVLMLPMMSSSLTKLDQLESKYTAMKLRLHTASK